jgi:hypothetical protein
MYVDFVATPLTVLGCGFNNQANAVAMYRGVLLIIFPRQGNLITADYLARSDKYYNAASDFQQLGLATPSKATPLFFLPSLQYKTRPDVSDIKQQSIYLTFYVITIRIPLWTQVLRCV